MPSISQRLSILTLPLCAIALYFGSVYAQSADDDTAAQTPQTPAAPADENTEGAETASDDADEQSEPAPADTGATPPVQKDEAQTAQAPEPEEEPVPYSRGGADSCLRCHDEGAEVPVLALFKTAHAVQADERTPFADLQCESCHGPGGEHGRRLRRGQERPPIRDFGRHASTPAAEQNTVCLDCHEDNARSGWHGSAHQRDDVACASCHRVHAAKDPMLVTGQQPEICMDCHKRQRAEFHKASTHPVRYGEMACSDCHEPHDSATDALLARPTLNQTCYQCHAEKRGPFLWEHAPASEDCSLCHRPHGSNHPDLLTRRTPLLCQQCHSRMGHPSVQYTGRGTAGRQPSPRVLAGSCTNCHSQVHGSNHPTGADLRR